MFLIDGSWESSLLGIFPYKAYNIAGVLPLLSILFFVFHSYGTFYYVFINIYSTVSPF